MSAAADREPTADLRISIWPEPSEDERVAIAAVIAIRSRRQAAAMAVDRMPVGSRWASAGRVEARRAGPDSDGTRRGRKQAIPVEQWSERGAIW
ncbi:hypothetical protein BH24CHL4_BH24CHL4_00860 [soil metagenome]